MAVNLSEKLKEEIFARQGVLADIYNKNKQFNITKYAASWEILNGKLDGKFVNVVRSLLLDIYGEETTNEIIGQLQINPLVSTIDHHGILNHPFFVNSNLFFSQRQNLKYLICFSTAGISLNNSSWPGCLAVNGKLGLKRFSFFSDKDKTGAVLAIAASKPENVEKALKKIYEDRELEPQEKERLWQLVKELFSDLTIFNCPSFASQASILSARLWKKIFPTAPEVVYLPIEEITATIIVEIITKEKDHFLHRLFFTRKGWELVEKFFDGTLGAFTSTHKGSFLFWGIDENRRRVHLHREESRIKNQESSFELNPENIARALDERRLYPGSLVCFLVMLYYQITALGGFNQVNWLTNIKERFLALLKEMGEQSIAQRIMDIPTTNFAEGNLAFMYQKNRLIKPSAIDLFLSGKDYYPRYQILAKQMTLGESLESLLPEIYRVITPAKERKESLMAISDEDILKKNRTDELIRSIIL